MRQGWDGAVGHACQPRPQEVVAAVSSPWSLCNCWPTLRVRAA